MSLRTVTHSVETESPPDKVVEVLSDLRLIHVWAPGFADSVEHVEGHQWRVYKDDKTFLFQVMTEASSRTVDYLREVRPGELGGAYLRVLPRPRGGSVIVMTLPIPPGGDAETVSAILRQELSALVELSESRKDE